MNDPSASISELIYNYPEVSVEELSRAVIEYIGTDDFQIRLISSIDGPSRGKLAIRKKRIQRYRTSRKNMEAKRLEFSENFVNIKNAIKDHTLALRVWQSPISTIPITGVGITAPNQTSQFSLFLDGFTIPQIMTDLNTNGIDASTVVSIKQKIYKNLMAIKGKIQNDIPLTLYSINDIIKVRNIYSDNPKMMNELLTLLRRNVSIRNDREGTNIIKNFEDFMREVPFEQDYDEKTETNSKLTKIDRYIRAIVLNELDIASENLTNDFLENKITFEEYIEKKNRIYEDGNNFWPQ